MDLREVGCDPGEWIDLAEDRGLCKDGNEPPGSLKANQSVYINIHSADDERMNFLHHNGVKYTPSLCPKNLQNSRNVHIEYPFCICGKPLSLE